MSEMSRPSFRDDACGLPDDPRLGLVPIPEGPFVMGAGVEAHEVRLPRFWIARYPTTRGQLRAAVRAGGVSPADPRALEGQDDHPAQWIDWFEALEYCRWLGGRLERMAASGAIEDRALRAAVDSGDYRVCLPSEAEWEKAARGPDGGAYPWGDEFDPARCNTADAGVGATTPVGAFPAGASPYGLLDMCGNVWCYLRTLWGPRLEDPRYGYPYDPHDGRDRIEAPAAWLRCARGGAFTVEPERARSTFRDAIPPDSRDDADGFRVVISSLVPAWSVRA